MVNWRNELSFSLESPIPYKGSEVIKIFLFGRPIRKADSAYEAFRKEVGLEHLAAKNPEVVLDQSTYYDMQAEAFAYAYRVIVRSVEAELWNPKEIVNDLDALVNILTLARNYTGNISAQLRIDRQLAAASALLGIYMSEVLMDGKNYAWAAELLKQGSGSIPSHSPGVELPFELAYPGNQGVLVSMQIPNLYSKEWGEYISMKLEDVENAQKNTPKPHNNMLPDKTYHPKSLQAQEDSAVAEERYKDAAMARDRIAAANRLINGLILDSMANPFIRHVAYALMTQLAEDGLSAHISQDSFSLERRVNGSPEIIMSATGKVESEKTFTVPTDIGLAARVLHLINSRPYVMKFGRFDSHSVPLV